MKKLPFCGECAFYWGRAQGKGVCIFKGSLYVSEHIKNDFWCIHGLFKDCRGCKFEDGSDQIRCQYCRSVYDDTGVYSEWSAKE